MAALRELLGPPPVTVVAFGDQENGREMLRQADIGIAVANAAAAVRRDADMTIALIQQMRS